MGHSAYIADLASFEWAPLAAGLVGAGVLAIVLALAHGLASRKRRRLFISRPAVSEDEWFERYYPLAVEERPVVMPALQELARLLGIHWTQLRAEDKFSHNLRLRWRFLNARQDELGDMSEWLVSWAERNGVSLESLGPLEDELGRHLDQLREAYKGRINKEV